MTFMEAGQQECTFDKLVCIPATQFPDECNVGHTTMLSPSVSFNMYWPTRRSRYLGSSPFKSYGFRLE